MFRAFDALQIIKAAVLADFFRSDQTLKYRPPTGGNT